MARRPLLSMLALCWASTAATGQYARDVGSTVEPALHIGFPALLSIGVVGRAGLGSLMRGSLFASGEIGIGAERVSLGLARRAADDRRPGPDSSGYFGGGGGLWGWSARGTFLVPTGLAVGLPTHTTYLGIEGQAFVLDFGARVGLFRPLRRANFTGVAFTLDLSLGL